MFVSTAETGKMLGMDRRSVGTTYVIERGTVEHFTKYHCIKTKSA